MASYFPRGNYYYIYRYDNLLGKRRMETTGLLAIPENLPTVKERVKQEEERQRRIKRDKALSGIKSYTLIYAINDFKKKNQYEDESEHGYKTLFNAHLSKKFDFTKNCRLLFNRASVEDFFLYLKKLPTSEGSAFQYGRRFNCFLNFLWDYQYIDRFQVSQKVKPQQPAPAPNPFKLEELIIYYEKLDRRNIPLVQYSEFARWTGKRPNEILGLSVDDIDTIAKSIKWRINKTKDVQTLPYHEALHEMLCELKRRLKPDAKLFPKSEDHYRDMVNNHIKSCGFSNLDLKTYSFRSLFQNQALDCDAQFIYIEILVGHTLKGSMAHYISKDSTTVRKHLNRLAYPVAPFNPYSSIPKFKLKLK